MHHELSQYIQHNNAIQPTIFYYLWVSLAGMNPWEKNQREKKNKIRDKTHPDPILLQYSSRLLFYHLRIFESKTR